MRRSWLQALALSLTTLGLGVWGLGWTLPSKERLAWVLPPGLDGPAFHASLQESWRKMHETLGENLMLASEELTSFRGLQKTAAGWKEPPPLLVNPVRSFYLRSAHDDEQTFLILFSKMRPKKLDFRPRMYLYGGGYLYPLGAWMLGGTFLGAGHLSHELSAFFARPDWLAGLYLSGRLFSLAAWLGVVLLVWRLGRKLIGECCGVGAALVCALSPGAMVQAHVMKQHTLWPLWALACFYASLKVLEGGSQNSEPRGPRWLTAGPLRHYLLAGALAGLAAGTFTLAATACLFPAAAALLRVLRRGAAWRAEARGLAWAAGAAVLAFFAVNPYWLADLPTVRAELASNTSYFAFRALAAWQFLSFPLRLALGWPVELAALAGLVLASRSKDDRLLLLGACFLVSCLPIYVSGGAYQDRGIRYFLSTVAFSGLLAAYAAERTRPSGGWWRILHGGACALALAHLALRAATVGNNFAAASGAQSTHRRAGVWLEENVKPGESVGLWELPRPANAPFFRLDRFPLALLDYRDAEKLDSKDLPEWIVLHQPKLFRRPEALQVLENYALTARFERPKLVPWLEVHWSETTANPVFEIYRKKKQPSRTQDADSAP